MAEMIRPSRWLDCYIEQIPRSGQVLDLACGGGRHTRLLADRNYPVFAVDRNNEAISGLINLPGVETACLNLEEANWPLAGRQFAGIVVTNYLWRPRLEDTLALLAPGGVLIYETFMIGNEAFGRPSNPEFLLQPGELRQRMAPLGWKEIAFFEGYASDPKPCCRQAIVARRPLSA